MGELQIINQQEVLGRDFKVYGDFENPLFLAKDVAEWIEYGKNTGEMLSCVDGAEKLTTTVSYSGQNREMWFLTEDGLYEVLMQSRKPIAKAFKKEVKQILKAIRKHGAYMTAPTIESILQDPDTIIRLATALKEEQSKSKQLQVENATLVVDKQVMAPKADYFDELVDRNLLTGVYETAKQLGVAPKKFTAFLLEHKYVFRDKRGKLAPYQPHVESGLFALKECFNEKTTWSGTQLMITPKGRETFRLLCIPG